MTEGRDAAAASRAAGRPPRTPRLLTAAALVVVIAGVKAAGALILPVLVAALLTVLAAPTVMWLERRHVPSALSVVVVILGLLASVALFVVLLSTGLRGFDDALPAYQDGVLGLWAGARAWLADRGVVVTTEASLQLFDPSAVMKTMSSLLGTVVAALSNTALVLIVVVFMVLEVSGFPGKLRAALSDPAADLSRWEKAMSDVQRYLAIKTVICAATGALIAIWLWLIGVNFPILWGVLAFMLNYIPSIGSFVAAAPTLMVAMVQPDLGSGAVGLVALGYVVVNVSLGNLLEPQLMGRRFRLSALVVFLSLLFWGWVWGPLGMLLSVPLTMAARIVMEQHSSTHWVAVLLGPPLPNPTSTTD